MVEGHVCYSCAFKTYNYKKGHAICSRQNNGSKMSTSQFLEPRNILFYMQTEIKITYGIAVASQLT